MLEEFKEAASRILTPHASAILLDRNMDSLRLASVQEIPVFCWPTNEPAMTKRFRAIAASAG